MDRDWLERARTRVIEEWPAVLAVIVLIGAHLLLTFATNTEATPLGIPLIAAIVAFITAELGRQIVPSS